MGSHSVTCGDFPAFTPAKVGTRFRTPEGCKAELAWWWLNLRIVYLPNTVTYLTNNQPVSWLGIESTTESRESNVLTTTPQSYLPVSGSLE